MNEERWRQLTELAKSGDKSAWSELYRETDRSVYYTCLKLLANEQDAKDAMQDAYMTAMEKIGTLGDGAKFPKWLSVIAVNRCRQSFRGKVTQSLEEKSEQGFEPIDEGFIPEDYVTDAAKRKIIMNIIESELSPEQRQTVILYYYNEMKIAQIAHLMECPESTVGYRLNAARSRIREAVLIYERENDDRLHAAVPIPILTRLFKAEEQSIAVPDIRGTLGLTIQQAANAAAPAAEANIAENGVKAMFGTLKAKIIAGVAALIVAAGGIAAAVALSNNDDEGSVKKSKKEKDESSVVMVDSEGDSSQAGGSEAESSSQSVDENAPDAQPTETHEYVQTSAEDYEYLEYEDFIMLGTYTGDAEYIITPTEINGKPVTAIDFTNDPKKCKIKGIKISEGVTELCEEAFRYLKLEEVELPESLVYIGRAAFGQDTGKGTLKNGTIKIPKNVKFIGEYAFAESSCDFEFSGGLEFIGENAFSNKTMGEKFRAQAEANNGLIIIDKVLYKVSSFDNGEVKIPDNIVAITDAAFEGTSYSKITIPKSVQVIGSRAFIDMENLTDFEIEAPENIKYIGSRVFSGGFYYVAPWWESYKENHKEWIVGDILCWVDPTLDETEYTIPDGIRKIAPMTFYGTRLKTVNMPDSITDIGANAFYKTEVNSVSFSKGLKRIGNSAFNEAALKELELPEGVEVIQSMAFYSNGNLTQITLPDSVKIAETSAFGYLLNLESIDLGTLEYIPASLVSTCKKLKSAKLADDTKIIGSFAFSACKELEEINVNDTAKIGGYAFQMTPFDGQYPESYENMTIAVPSFAYVTYEMMFG